MEESVSSITIPGYTIKDNVVYYTVSIRTPLRQWTVSRRYNHFYTLHSRFLQRFPNQSPPAPLPPKHLHLIPRIFSSGMPDKQEIEERRQALEHYVKAILISTNSGWRTSTDWTTFMQYPIPRAHSFSSLTSDIADDKPTETPIKQEYTSATWLSALNNQDASVITLRTLARKLDTTSQKMAVTGINAQNARSEFQRVLTEAQQQTTSIYGVLDELTAWLDDARELAPGERRRRSDLVSNMRAQVRTLEKLLDKHKNGSVGGSWEQRTIASSASPSSSFSFQRAPTGSSLRSTSTNTDHDSYDAPSGAARERAQLLSNSSPPRPMSRRVFGNAFASETPETQPLDNEGLVQLQRQHIKNQDAQLDELSNVLVRQKEIGFQIHDELTLQNQMLGDLETDVDRVKGKVDKANNQMKKIQ